jgi:restriction endonuclease Mrr
MPEELAIGLVVIVVVGWLIISAVAAASAVARRARAQISQIIGSKLTKLHQKRRGQLDSDVQIVLPPNLKQAEKRLREIEAAFDERRRVSSWTPTQPRWDKLEFIRLNFPDQGPASQRLNILGVHSILSPQVPAWHVEEQELLSRSCLYPAPFKSETPLPFHEFAVPTVVIEPATLVVTPGAISDKTLRKYYENEVRAVEAYNSQRDHLLSWYRNLTAAIETWNREETQRWNEYRAACEALSLEEEALYNTQAKQYEAACAQQRDEIFRTLEGFKGRDKSAVLKRVAQLLSSLKLPHSLPRFWNLDYDDTEHILIVEVALPDVVHQPPVKTVVQKSGCVIKPLNQSERRELVPKVHPAIMLRVAYEILRSDPFDTIKLLVLNGWVDYLDPHTGRATRAYTASVVLTAEQVGALDLQHIDPLAAFQTLKGKSAGKLIEIVPIEPALNLKRTDSRFVDAKAVLDSLAVTTNLAAMDWQDFEHLIRELFEREFADRGAEVKITQASRDRGVDAIAFNPDPIQGGKYIIQAKRYTNTVDVSAVRDLCAVVRKEGASRGILVTTSTYGADAYEFANNEPVTLLNGGQLLGLLEKHGYKFRIDLAEARRMRSIT